MSTSSEEISKSNANSSGRTDANLANDSLNLGGIPAEDYATKEYVHKYHDNKEKDLKNYIDQQDEENLGKAKAYADSIVQGQDFSGFAKTTDVQAVDEKLTKKIEDCGTNCEKKLNEKISAVVEDVNSNFDDLGKSIEKLNQGQNDLFQSVSDGKRKIAGAITDKGVYTSASETFDTMAQNIRKIETGGSGELDPNFVNTSDGTATESDIVLGKTAYVKGSKIYGTHTEKGINTDDATATAMDIKKGITAYSQGRKLIGVHEDKEFDLSDATATPYDILSGKTAYTQNGKITGVLTINEENNLPEYSIGSVEKIYGSVDAMCKTFNYTTLNSTSNELCSIVCDKNGNIIMGIVVNHWNHTITTYARYIEGSDVRLTSKTYTMSELGINDKEDTYRVGTSLFHGSIDKDGYAYLAISADYMLYVYKLKYVISKTITGLREEFVQIDIDSKMTYGNTYSIREITFSPTRVDILKISDYEYTNSR